MSWLNFLKELNECHFSCLWVENFLYIFKLWRRIFCDENFLCLDVTKLSPLVNTLKSIEVVDRKFENVIWFLTYDLLESKSTIRVLTYNIPWKFSFECFFSPKLNVDSRLFTLCKYCMVRNLSKLADVSSYLDGYTLQEINLITNSTVDQLIMNIHSLKWAGFCA